MLIVTTDDLTHNNILRFADFLDLSRMLTPNGDNKYRTVNNKMSIAHAETSNPASGLV